MKNKALYSSLVIAAVLFGCSGNQDKEREKALAAAKMDSLALNTCYVAVDSNDKAELRLATLSDGKVNGSLLINYAEKGKNDGLLSGEFKGDTLFVDYTFKIGTKNPTVYKNPLAFLKRGDSLILGVGQIETSLGRSYFVKGKPIRFDRSKFIFGPTECK